MYILEPPAFRHGEFQPINLLKKAGVDMASTDPVNEALKTFSSMVDKLEELIL